MPPNASQRVLKLGDNMTKKIDYMKVQDLAARLFTQQAIARIIGFTPEGFCRRNHEISKLRDVLERGHAEAEISLRTAQFNKALGSNRNDPKKIGLDGDTRMLIQLDKRFFGGDVTERSNYLETTSPPIKTLAELVASAEVS